MSEAIAFNTHEFIKRLTASGFTEPQAEALAAEHFKLLNENLATKSDFEAFRSETQTGFEALRLANKSDIEALRSENKAEFQTLRSENKAEFQTLRSENKADIQELRAETRTDIQALQAETRADIEGSRLAGEANIANVQRDIEALRSDLLKWMAGAMLAQGALIVSLVKLL